MRTTKIVVISLALLTAGEAQAQSSAVTGRLVPDAGVPYAGAAITVAGATVCADELGGFALDLPEGTSRIRIAPVGAPARELLVSRGDAREAIATPDYLVELAGIEVVAMPEPPSSLGSTVDSGELTAATAGSIPASMQAKLTGADVRRTSHAPGGAFEVRLRGIRTIIGNAQPIFVVDGTVVSGAIIPTGSSVILGTTSVADDAVARIADLNPEDVERIEVLKGIDAMTRFGSNAGAGAVVITTRRGRVDNESPLRCFLSR